MSIRIRLSFDELVPGFSKKTWFLFDAASCRVVADLEHLIQKKFGLQRNATLHLYSEGFLLPSQEKIELVRDGDIIRIERRASFLKERVETKEKLNNKDTMPTNAKKQKIAMDSQKKEHIEQRNDKKGSKRKKEINIQKKQSNCSETKQATRQGTCSSKKEKRLKDNETQVEVPIKTKVILNKRVTQKSRNLDLISGKPASRKATFTRKRAPSSSSSSISTSLSSTSSSIKEKNLKYSESADKNMKKIDENSSKRNHKIATFTSNSGNIFSSSLSSASSSSSLTSSSEVSCDNENDKNDLNAKTKEDPLHENSKTKENLKTTIAAPSVQARETSNNQSITPQQVDPQASLGKSSVSSGNLFSAARNSDTRTNCTIARSNNNSHIRFDSDEERQDNSAVENNQFRHSNTEYHGYKYPYIAAINNNNITGVVSRQIKPSVPQAISNRTMNGNGNKRMGEEIVPVQSQPCAAAAKKTALDYSSLPSLHGPPRIADRIAYKVLEMSASYTPEMSDYKEGVVIGYNHVTNEVMLELTEESLAKPLGDGNVSTKFELIYENEDEENEPKPPVVADRKVSVCWTSMVDPKLINPA